ncbi:hypothetical protein ABLG96_07790 [Nakamurella sp. A5-74]|uniref:Flagellin Flp1-like domain-containing protein n=1 Tax=Nakamurella sp. A5-74 TaxID=3158264 RepID=A0AAU8DWG2_9ACTN
MMEKWATHGLAFTLTMLTALTRQFGEPEPEGREGSDRGDVPGWVMITVMTAIVVVALVSIFGKEVQDAITKAFSSVGDSKIGK